MTLSPLVWTATVALIVALLLFDYFFHIRKAHIPTLKESASWSVAAGADLIIAQGMEAGAHTGDITSMVLWPQVVDAVAPLPMLAAGGIGRGRQMAAAFALGAQGVWCGSIWLGTRESELSPAMKQRMFAARSEDAIQRRVFTGKQCRMLRSKFTDAWDSPDAPEPLPMPMQSLLVQEACARIEHAGKTDYMGYYVGQVVGDMREETSVRRIFADMLMELSETLERLGVGIGEARDSDESTFRSERTA